MMLPRLQEALFKTLFRPIPSRQLGPKLQEYLEREPLAGHPPFSQSPGVIAKVGTGRNAIVRRWDHPDMGVLFARAWRYDFRVRPAQEHAHAGRLLASAGLRVPELLLVDDSVRTLRRYRLELVVERAAEGLSMEESGPPDRDLLRRWAGELARLHTTEQPRWGKPWCPENEAEDPMVFWLGRLSKFRRRIPGNLGLLADEDLLRGLRETEKLLRGFRFEKPVLVHGDINPDNLFVDSEGALTWIDFGTVHFGLAAEDLVNVHKWLDPLGLFDVFCREYEAAGGATRTVWQVGFDLMQRLMAFEKLSSRIVKTTRRVHLQGAKRDRLVGEQEAYERRVLELFGRGRGVE